MAKIFISYKRNVEPDMPVALTVYKALANNHDVFIDQTLQVGDEWAKRIQNEIIESDYLVVFLSENSVYSEMVIAEIETAHQQKKEKGKPVILPVRLDYDESFVYPLSAYLNPLQWAIWKTDKDTLNLIEELQQAITGIPFPDKQLVVKPSNKGFPTAFANLTIESSEGTMPLNSAFYIEREADQVALNTVPQQGYTITIKAPRQMGKSSLLARIINSELSIGKKVAFLDFQMIEKATFLNPERFYRHFCSWVSTELEMDDKTEEFWKSPLGNVQRTTHYFQDYLLPNQQKSILMAMDEVERVFNTAFRSDFFSMLRSWHNARATKSIWKNYNQALVTSTEPYQFINDLNQSPFNVGEVIDLDDFNLAQVSELNNRYGYVVSGDEIQNLFNLLGGHPYLTRRAFFLISSHRITFNNLIASACEDNGPFGDHLRNLLFRMYPHNNLKKSLVEIIYHNACSNEHDFFRLRGAGLVRRKRNKVLPRNSIYAEYFAKRLNG